MIRIVRDSDAVKTAAQLSKACASENVDALVAGIIADVRENGDEALRRLTRIYDGAEISGLELPPESMSKARISPEMRATLEKARDNIMDFHSRQKREGFISGSREGVMTGQRLIPLERVGLYIPGGTARYPSSVLMNAIPARVAGVREIIMVTPPDRDGKVPEVCLAAAFLAGVDRVFCIGGAQAVAALAYGTETVPAVDKITGPGNIYVQTAKRLVYGQTDIDMIAGPSDITVIADESANPEFIAADMLSQAEHGELSAAILITVSEDIALRTKTALERRLAELPRSETAAAALRDRSAIVITDSLTNAVKTANAIAPEHLELAVAEPWALLASVRNAGSVFLGHYTPESLGDYLAGPNHTLPTEGTARYASPLGVEDFVKRSSFLYYSRKALEKDATDVARFARAEGLEAHALAAEVRVL